MAVAVERSGREWRFAGEGSGRGKEFIEKKMAGACRGCGRGAVRSSIFYIPSPANFVATFCRAPCPESPDAAGFDGSVGCERGAKCLSVVSAVVKFNFIRH
jgi:hypothetical protein